MTLVMSVGFLRLGVAVVLAGLLAVGLPTVSAAHSAPAPVRVFIEDFEACTSNDLKPTNTTTARGLPADQRILLTVKDGVVTCPDWVVSSSQAWLAEYRSPGPPLPLNKDGGEGFKAIWLNEYGGKLSRPVTGLAKGSIHRVSVEAWTDDRFGDTYLDIRFRWTVAGQTYVKDIVKTLPSGSGINLYERDFCAYETSVNVELFQARRVAASPIVDNFKIQNLGTACVLGDDTLETIPSLGFPDFEARVTFFPNGGNGSMDPQLSKAPTSLTPNSFARDGFRFVGWKTLLGEGDAETAVFSADISFLDGAEYSFSSDLVLFAVWEAIPPPLQERTPKPVIEHHVDEEALGPALAATGPFPMPWKMTVWLVVAGLFFAIYARLSSRRAT